MTLGKFLPTLSFVLVVGVACLVLALPAVPVGAQALDPVDADSAQVVRWQAMAEYYAAHGMLNERFDYEEADSAQVVRWQAMAEYYAAHGMLNERFNYEEAVVLQARRQQAIADASVSEAPGTR